MNWLSDLAPGQLALLLVVMLVVLLLGSAWFTRWAVRRGLRTPWGVRRVNGVRERLVKLVKRPITIMVLDEVADVIQTGHYTKNISDAIVENHDELKALAAEKIKMDPNIRVLGKLPGSGLVISEISETTLRVLIDMLGDPRMDELVSDLLRNNLQQIKVAVRQRAHENVPVHDPEAT